MLCRQPFSLAVQASCVCAEKQNAVVGEGPSLWALWEECGFAFSAYFALEQLCPYWDRDFVLRAIHTRIVSFPVSVYTRGLPSQTLEEVRDSAVCEDECEYTSSYTRFEINGTARGSFS